MYNYFRLYFFLTNHLHIIFLFQFVAVSTLKKILPSCKTETGADASAYERPSSFNSNGNDDQHEEEGAQEDDLWNDVNTSNILFYDRNLAPSFEIPTYLQAELNKFGNTGKTTLENITASPFTGKSTHSQHIQGVNTEFLYRKSDSVGSNKENRTVEVVILVFGTMIKKSPAMMMKEYCQVLNDSHPCWYAQIFFIFIAEYVLSGNTIDLATMKKLLTDFYAKVFPLFHCKARAQKGKTMTVFRHPNSLYSNSDEAKAVNRLIKGDLRQYLPYLAAKADPMDYIRSEIVPVMLEEFNLNQIGAGVDKYFVLNRLVEQPHWFYKDYIKQLELAGLRPLIPFRLALQQVYLLDGVTVEQHKQLLRVGLQHAKSNTGKNKGYVVYGKKKFPSKAVEVYISCKFIVVII